MPWVSDLRGFWYGKLYESMGDQRRSRFPMGRTRASVDRMMQLAVFGASGRTGQEILRLAESKVWGVRALVRPSSTCDPRAGLEIVRGFLHSAADVLATIQGAEAVCCVFGPRSARAQPFCALATCSVIEAMVAVGSRRLLCLTGAMVGELPANVSLAMRVMAAAYRRLRPELAADASAQERTVIESDLDWTLVKPPRLTNERAGHRVRADRRLRIGMTNRLSRADLAAFMLDEVLACRHVRERVYVCV